MAKCDCDRSARSHAATPDVAAMSTVYTVQGRFEAFNTSYLPLFDFSDPAMSGTVRRMHAYMQTVLSYENAPLMAGYDSALVELAGDGPKR